MEYVEGLRPLKKIVGSPDSPFHRDAVRSLGIYVRILDALWACERAGIVHRDLSLGNVLVMPDNQGVKLIDFGCCRLEEGHAVTLTDEAVGTPLYRAPECEGLPGEPTTRADLYSAGKLLWSLVTNRRAFSRERSVFNELTLNKVLPHDPMTWHLHHIFEKTVRANPKDRYDNVAAALEDAERVKNRIKAGFLPLEILDTMTCPICGVGKLTNAPRFYESTLIDPQTFRNGRDEEVVDDLRHLGSAVHRFRVCPYCGFAVVSVDAIRKRALKSRTKLE